MLDVVAVNCTARRVSARESGGSAVAYIISWDMNAIIGITSTASHGTKTNYTCRMTTVARKRQNWVGVNEFYVGNVGPCRWLGWRAPRPQIERSASIFVDARAGQLALLCRKLLVQGPINLVSAFSFRRSRLHFRFSQFAHARCPRTNCIRRATFVNSQVGRSGWWYCRSCAAPTGFWSLLCSERGWCVTMVIEIPVHIKKICLRLIYFFIHFNNYQLNFEKRMLYGALVVTLWTCYGALQVVVVLLLLLLADR